MKEKVKVKEDKVLALRAYETAKRAHEEDKP